MFQNCWIQPSGSVLLFFAAALPLLAGCQLLRVFLERHASRAREAAHAAASNQGLPDPYEVAAQLATIDTGYPRVLPMALPKHGVPLALLAPWPKNIIRRSSEITAACSCRPRKHSC